MTLTGSGRRREESQAACLRVHEEPPAYTMPFLSRSFERRCRSRIRSSLQSSRARARSRAASISAVGTATSTTLPTASILARNRASRLSVFTRSPEGLSILLTAPTQHSTPAAESDLCRSKPVGPLS